MGESEVSVGTMLVLGAFAASVGVIAIQLVVWAMRAVSALVLKRMQQQQQPSSKAGGKKAGAQQQQPVPAEPRRQPGSKQPNLKDLIKQSQHAKKHAVTKEDMAAHHALFINTLRGHGDVINGIAWSPDGRLLATACDDMGLRLWDLADPAARDPKFKHKELRQAPLGVGFGNDAQSLVVALRGYPDINLAQLSPHKGPKAGGALAWETDWETASVLGHEQLLDMAVVPAPQAHALGHATGGGVAVLLSPKKEGAVFGLASGSRLASFAPNSFTNHGLAVSADGRFIAVASFTADVKVWEVCWGRTGYNGTTKAMDLKGHSSQVMSAAFAPDGSRAVTASKDGSLRIWNTAVRYQLQEDPKVLLKAALPLPEGQVFERLAWGPDGTIAAALGGHIHFLDSRTGKVLEVLHAHDGAITAMVWCPRRLQLAGQAEPVAVLASASTDRRVRIWRSPASQQ